MDFNDFIRPVLQATITNISYIFLIILDIEALSNVVSTLIEEVRSLKASQPSQPSQSPQKEKSVEPLVGAAPRKVVSISPEPATGYRRRNRKLLEDMDERQYKSFHVSIEQLLICCFKFKLHLKLYVCRMKLYRFLTGWTSRCSLIPLKNGKKSPVK